MLQIPTITLKLEQYKPTMAKQDMDQKMAEINTEFANGLLLRP
jgi:hypothetical protein